MTASITVILTFKQKIMNHHNSRNRGSQSSRQSDFYQMAEEIYQLGYEHGYDDGADDQAYDDDIEQEEIEQFFDEDDFYDQDSSYDNNLNEDDHPRDSQGRFIPKGQGRRSNNSTYSNRSSNSQSYGNRSQNSRGQRQSSRRSNSNHNDQRSYYNSADNRTGSNSSRRTNNGSSRRGFAAMSKAKRTEIARMGGRASHGGGRSNSSSRGAYSSR